MKKEFKIGDRVEITESTALKRDEVLGKQGVIISFDEDDDEVILLDTPSETYGKTYTIDNEYGDSANLLTEK